MDATFRHKLLSFMDVFSGHNKIPMLLDFKKIIFINIQGLYYYNAMLFGLKNVRAIY